MVGRATSFPPGLRAFVRLFNRGAFWESHEVLEDPWREEGSAFYHGLILFASAFVHVERDNAHGIRAQLGKAERALEPYAPHYLGVDVADLLERCRRGRRAVVRAEADPPAAWAEEIRPPRLSLDPSLRRGDEPELGPSPAPPGSDRC